MADLPHHPIVLSNTMGAARSPYLLQHANNPVHWQPWGEQAFAAARALDRPVLLSVGYAACHWCHVMAHESFEDEAMAAQLNRDFVCIKVDREERPDVDAVYMAVTTALNQGRGGWPMTVLMTADKQPFFAGTYFPPRAMRGMPGFGDILQQVSHMWQHERPRLVSMAGSIVDAVQSEPAPTACAMPDAAAAQRCTARAVHTLSERFDAVHGGFTGAPKFPHTEVLRLLLQQQQRLPALRPMLHTTLTAMAQGGLYDIVGGGFSRYSVDAAWHVPHFEKMLYDNALLAATYAEASMALGEPGYARVARATLDFVQRELMAEDGTFYAALDADSEGHEGRFYVWTEGDARAALAPHMPPDAVSRALDALSMTAQGNWEEGVNIARLQAGLPGDDALVSQATAHLLRARAHKVRPALDDKVLTGHNGLMLQALALGARALSDEGCIAVACRTADALWSRVMTADGVLLRLPPHPQAESTAGMLEDYAYLAEGLLALYEAGGPAHHLERATVLCRKLVQLFAHGPSGALYETGSEHEPLLFRPLQSHDGATPSAYATAAHVLLRVAVHAGDGGLQAAGEAALGAMATSLEDAPHAHCRALMALAFAHHGGEEAVLVSRCPPWQKEALTLFAPLLQAYAPHRVLAHGDGSSGGQQGPLLAHRPAVRDLPTVYLCRRQTCLTPIADAVRLREALSG